MNSLRIASICRSWVTLVRTITAAAWRSPSKRAPAAGLTRAETIAPLVAVRSMSSTLDTSPSTAFFTALTSAGSGQAASSRAPTSSSQPDRYLYAEALHWVMAPPASTSSRPLSILSRM